VRRDDGVLTAHLLEIGVDVTAVTNPEIARALSQHGARVTGEAAPPPLCPRAVVERVGAAGGRFDFILLATQPPQVEEAARSAAPWLADDGRLVCFQNGLCEDAAARSSIPNARSARSSPGAPA
jgi:2-dehydropantoate 2-reductase